MSYIFFAYLSPCLFIGAEGRLQGSRLLGKLSTLTFPLPCPLSCLFFQPSSSGGPLGYNSASCWVVCVCVFGGGVVVVGEEDSGTLQGKPGLLHALSLAISSKEHASYHIEASLKSWTIQYAGDM